jgi:hypothetical protein
MVFVWDPRDKQIEDLKACVAELENELQDFEADDELEAALPRVSLERDRFKIALIGTLPWLEYLLANHANLAGLPQDIDNIKSLTN